MASARINGCSHEERHSPSSVSTKNSDQTQNEKKKTDNELACNKGLIESDFGRLVLDNLHKPTAMLLYCSTPCFN